MSPPRFALDEDVSHRLAGLLRSHGEDADSARELGRLGLTDAQALSLAADFEQTLVTHNDGDFRALHEAWITWHRRWSNEIERDVGRQVDLSRHSGILIVPHGSVHELAQIIEEFAASEGPWMDKLFVWSRARGWQELLLAL